MNSFLNLASENQLLTILAVLSFVLLIVVTGGVAYLTIVEWRDKRRRGDAARSPLRATGLSQKGMTKGAPKGKKAKKAKSK